MILQTATKINNSYQPHSIPIQKATEKNLQDFYQKGYFILKGVFSPEDIKIYSQAFDRLQEMAKQFKTTTIHNGSQFVVDGDRIDRIVWMGGAEPVLLTAGEDPRLLSVVSQILKVNEFHQLICQGHYKLPGDTVQFDWHQDCQHRGIGTADWNDIDGRGSYVQTLTAIDPVTMENGPVIFVPTDTKVGYLGLDKSKNPTSLFDVESGVPALMEPGDVAFFSPYSVHGSYPNNSKHKRRVFINGFALVGANTKQYPGEGSGRLVRLKN
jgi:ectoine hydroxylase-related dioxygenase (phytanoyl-CoA dioxygenase family)